MSQSKLVMAPNTTDASEGSDNPPDLQVTWTPILNLMMLERVPSKMHEYANVTERTHFVYLESQEAAGGIAQEVDNQRKHVMAPAKYGYYTISNKYDGMNT